MSASTSVLAPPRHLRLRLKPKAPVTGHVDGAWWPHSRDLLAEAPELLAVLAVRLGRIERLTYNLGQWHPPDGKLIVEGAPVRLDGFHAQPADTVAVVGSGGRHRLILLVVPPERAERSAHDALMTASHRGNIEEPTRLLAEPDGIPASDSATRRWEAEGGSTG